MSTIYSDEVTLTVSGSGSALLANDIESATEVSQPGLNLDQLLANDLESASEVTTTAIGVIHNVLANDVESASSVTTPFGEEVQAAPIIFNQPDDFTVQLPYDGALLVEANGVNGHALTYQWYRDGVLISGATSATYAVTGIVDADDGDEFYVIITDAVEPTFWVQSDTVTMTVLPAVAANGTAIKTKASHTPGAVPTTSNLSEGEIAINTADGKIYSRDDSDNIVTLGGLQDGSDLPTSDPAVAGALWNDSTYVKISEG